MEWQLSPDGLTAIGRKSLYHIVITETGVYLLDKVDSAASERIFTAEGDNRVKQCKEQADKWDSTE
jgi:hypothetical protein